MRTLLVAVLLLAAVGCAKPTPSKAWVAAMASYESLATGMFIYCSQPDANAENCIRAATAELQSRPIIMATKDKVEAGQVTDALLAAAVEAIKQATPALQKAQVK